MPCKTYCIDRVKVVCSIQGNSHITPMYRLTIITPTCTIKLLLKARYVYHTTTKHISTMVVVTIPTSVEEIHHTLTIVMKDKVACIHLQMTARIPLSKAERVIVVCWIQGNFILLL
jgi:hypothetical protein